MEANEADLLKINRGLVIAPAGCGKTQLIVDILKRYVGKKPILVLTHTNAGVGALRNRLKKEKVDTNKYRLETIDGWALRLISKFPKLSQYDIEVLKIANPKRDYPRIREFAAKILQEENIKDILSASYAHLLVDEYQDCSIHQHNIIDHAAEAIPTLIFGDPMQAIFGFSNDSLAHWDRDVSVKFPLVRTLSTPWRWNNSGNSTMGSWLLEVRKKLLNGEQIDLRVVPNEVKWIEFNQQTKHAKWIAASNKHPSDEDGNVLIIGDSINQNMRRDIAKKVSGADLVEPIDLKGLVVFLTDLRLEKPEQALNHLAQFMEGMMSFGGAKGFVRRVESLSTGRSKKKPTEAEKAAHSFLENPSYTLVIDILEAITQQHGVRTFRSELLRSCIRALQICHERDGLSFQDAVNRVREQNRLSGRLLPQRAVGSTLLLKGLEADIVVILNAAELDAKNLYVAMTRGSKAIRICSPTYLLNKTPCQ